MSGSNMRVNEDAYLKMLRAMENDPALQGADWTNGKLTFPGGQPQSYDPSTGQGYATTPSPYTNVPARTGGVRTVPPQQVARPEQRPGSPPSTPAPQVPEDQAGSDPLSPRTLIYNYLREKGMPLTSDNVRRALEANAANRGVIGGTGRDDAYSNAEMPVHLINDVAGTDPKTSAAPGQRKPLPTPPVPPRMGDEQGPPYTPPVGVESNPILDIAKRVLGGIPPPGPGSPPPQWPSGPPSPSPVGSPPVPQMNPPTPGAEVAIPTPADPMNTAMNRAMQPRLPGPTAQLALPPPPVAPTPAQVPPVPQVEGSPRPLMIEGPKTGTPRVSVQQLPAPDQLRAPPISPQNPVVQGPVARGVGNVGAGIVSGARSGGPRGAAVGGGLAAAKEVIPPIVEQLVKRAARRKPPSPRPRKKADSEE